MSGSRPSTAAGGDPHRPPLTRAHFAPRYWGTWLGLGSLWVLQALPRPVTRAFVPLLAWLLRQGSPKRRRFAEINLRWCFPELAEERRDALLREHFRCAAQCLLDYGMLWFGTARTHERRIEVEGAEHFRHLLAEGRPAILLVPHSLALDHGGLRLSQIVDGVSFVKPLRNPVVDWLNQRSRSRYRADMFAREQGLRPVIREMRKGRSFYYLPDEDLGTDSAIFVDFFGVPKATLTSLARVARMTRADVLPTFAYYDRARDRYVLKLWPPLDDYPTSDEAADAAAMNAAIERCIREAPAQYLWTMRLFRTRPGGVPGPYGADSDTRRPAV
jgi:Kdo2-lipid IVA lauroyltransferase/acyltransferase